MSEAIQVDELEKMRDHGTRRAHRIGDQARPPRASSGRSEPDTTSCLESSAAEEKHQRGEIGAPSAKRGAREQRIGRDRTDEARAVQECVRNVVPCDGLVGSDARREENRGVGVLVGIALARVGEQTLRIDEQRARAASNVIPGTSRSIATTRSAGSVPEPRPMSLQARPRAEACACGNKRCASDDDLDFAGRLVGTRRHEAGFRLTSDDPGDAIAHRAHRSNEVVVEARSRGVLRRDACDRERGEAERLPDGHRSGGSERTTTSSPALQGLRSDGARGELDDVARGRKRHDRRAIARRGAWRDGSTATQTTRPWTSSQTHVERNLAVLHPERVPMSSASKTKIIPSRGPIFSRPM